MQRLIACLQIEGMAMNYNKAKLQHGYANQILAIDVSNRKCVTQAMDPQVRDYFLGGRGLGVVLAAQVNYLPNTG